MTASLSAALMRLADDLVHKLEEISYKAETAHQTEIGDLAISAGVTANLIGRVAKSIYGEGTLPPDQPPY